MYSGPRHDHGDPRKPFDAPALSTSCLNPPSKTKSFYSFGASGTVGWTTAAGELLQVASCIDNKLMGAEYKKNIQRGLDYEDRGKMLETAVNAPQGSGYGIGLSLGHPLEPVEKKWVYNRWPRFAYRHGALDIQLQYYIDSNRVIQEYRVRNASQEEVRLPYICSSDICFREHGSVSFPIYPVPTGKSPARLLLFQNSQVLVRNTEEQCQMMVALFLNGQRQPFWAVGEGVREDVKETKTLRSSLHSTDGLVKTDERLRRRILAGDLVDEAAESDFKKSYQRCHDHGQGIRHSPDVVNLACHKSNLIVPPGSTQELHAVIEISALSESKQSEPHLAPVPESESHREDHPNSGNNPVESHKERISSLRSQQKILVDRAKQLSLKNPGQDAKRRISKFLHDHLELGRSCSVLQLIGEARYHLFTACLIAEYLYKEDSYDLNHARFVYSKFLYNNAWVATALEIMETLYQTLSKQKHKAKEYTILWEKVQIWLPTMYLKAEALSKAESMYKNALPYTISEETILDPATARCLERLAWTQIRQDKFGAAQKNYSLLLKLPESRRQIILSNLGFIQWKLGHIQQAKSFFEESMKLGNASVNSMAQLYARSALYACLSKLGTRPEDEPLIACSLMRHADFDSLLGSSSVEIPMYDDPPFHFTIVRHLETLLSSCCVPVENNAGTAGIAFVDADPLNSSHEGSSSYFQFKFLTQCQMYINARQAETALYSKTSERIKHACQAHLVWVFNIAELSDTWAVYYPAGGNWIFPKVPAHERTESHALEGAFHFSKIWLYLKTWSQDWEFALDQLQLNLEGWLSYVRATQYMGNLWVERSNYDYLKPYDTINADNILVDQLNPQYQLSDFTTLWLALKQLEELIGLIEKSCEMDGGHEDDPAKRKVKEVRRIFNDHQNALGTETIRSNILKTFTILERGGSTFHFNTHQKTVSPPKENSSIRARAPIQLGTSDWSPNVEDSTAEGVKAFQESHTSEPARQVIAFARSVSEFIYTIHHTDIATIEAASAGFFNESKDQIRSAWQEALKMQLENHIAGYNDPRLIALTLHAARFKYTLSSTHAEKIERVCRERLAVALYDSGSFAQTILENTPEPTRYWTAATYQTLSVLIGALFEECRFKLTTDAAEQHDAPLTGLQLTQLSHASGSSPHQGNFIVMPQQVGTSPRFARKNVVADALFQPNWMYFPHDSLHQLPLQIDCEVEFKQVEDFQGFKKAIARWKESREFSTARAPRIFPPHVADSGTKKGAVFDGKPLERQMDIQWHGNAASFYDRLTGPRTSDSAKKRLVELTSFHQDLPLICWLTSPAGQKMYFLRFLHRHGSSESFFGERVDWKGNLWETELHLGFYQALSKEDNRTYPPPHMDYQGQFRVREMPSLSQISPAEEITPVTMSLRFIGDLRDQAWTCYFLTSVAKDYSFTGLVNEFTDGNGETSGADFHKEKMAQRKILEMVYVDRMLVEIAQSCQGIFTGFERELDVPETRDPQSESYEFIHNYSRFHSKTGEILRDVLKLLNLSVRTVEDWEKREDRRDIRSRWSQKDETRYGPKLAELARKCKISIQQVRIQRDLLEEQQQLAEQRHNNLINYMSLQAARTSSQSAEDVRLFTYVTIFFVPLSFSSSLFSMGGAPERSTISVMIPTTVIALAITILALANMKVLDRNLSFWTYRLNASARRKMEASEAPWGSAWKKISRELEEAAELRLAKPEDEKHLPAQSRWWYILFWFSYALDLPRLYMLEGFRVWEGRSNPRTNRGTLFIRVLTCICLVPACAFIFTVQFLMITAADLLGLVWQLMRWLKSTFLGGSHPKVEETQEEDVSSGGEKPRDVGRKSASIKSLDEPAHSSSNFEIFSSWLQVPPRPLQKLTTLLKPSPGVSDKVEPTVPGSDIKIQPLIQSDKMRSEEDEWEMIVEKSVVAQGETLATDAQSGILVHRRTSNGSYKQKPPWWTRMKSRKAPDSKV
ncbi:MAG: hypothetical protein Q9184_004370 [Pyrenodesmia sp. 2 TL-2023]